jgi:hypothetical protein
MTSPAARSETERVRRIQDKTAPRYDRQIRFFERLLRRALHDPVPDLPLRLQPVAAPAGLDEEPNENRRPEGETDQLEDADPLRIRIAEIDKVTDGVKPELKRGDYQRGDMPRGPTCRQQQEHADRSLERGDVVDVVLVLGPESSKLVEVRPRRHDPEQRDADQVEPEDDQSHSDNVPLSGIHAAGYGTVVV